jgi:hypothetical protein
MTTEIKDMMSSLMVVIQSGSHTITKPPSKPPGPERQVLHNPLSFEAKTVYTGKDYRYLVARQFDHIIVHAWENKKMEMAVAYNVRSNMSGLIPAEFLQKTEWRSRARCEICLTLSKSDKTGGLAWKSGHYIRICKWDDYKKRGGVGFNLATGNIGQFHTSAHKLKVVDSLPSVEIYTPPPSY